MNSTTIVGTSTQVDSGAACARRVSAGATALAGAMIALGACAAPATHTLAGVVSLGPTCGGPQREGPDCVGPLAGAEVRLLDPAGQIAARSVTDVAGRFEFAAPAGRYQVQLAVPKVVNCPITPVTLPVATAAPLSVRCDSGMR